jgi:hypothetical protein
MKPWPGSKVWLPKLRPLPNPKPPSLRRNSRLAEGAGRRSSDRCPTEAAQPAEELPDWLKGLAAEAPTAAQPEAAQPAEELPDWLKGMAAEAPTAAQPEAAQPAEELPGLAEGAGRRSPDRCSNRKLPSLRKNSPTG